MATIRRSWLLGTGKEQPIQAPSIILPRKWTTQPTNYTDINISNELTKNLFSVHYPLKDGVIFDPLNNHKLNTKPNYGTNHLRVKPYGQYLGIAEPINAGFSGTYKALGTSSAFEFTQFCLIYIKNGSITNSGFQYIFQTNVNFEVGGLITGTSLAWRNIAGERSLNAYFGWTQQLVSVNNVTDGLHLFCSTNKRYTTPKIYLDGNLVNEGVIENANYYYSLDNVIGGCYSSNTFDTLGIGGILLRGNYNRALTPSEIYELSKNPWQIFKKEERRIIILPPKIDDDRPVSHDVSVTEVFNINTQQPQIPVATSSDWLYSVNASNYASYGINGGKILTSQIVLHDNELAKLNIDYTTNYSFTIVGAIVRDSNETASVYVRNNTGQRYGFSVNLRDYDANTTQIAIRGMWSGASIWSNTIPCKVGEVIKFAIKVTWISGTSFNAQYYVNGKKLNNVSFYEGAGTLVTFNEFVGREDRFLFSCFTHKNLSDNQLIELSANPWQIFKSNHKTIISTYWPESKEQLPHYLNFSYKPKFTSQPQVPVDIDWLNPLTIGLSACVCQVSGVFMELTTNQILTAVGGTPGLTKMIGKTQKTPGAGVGIAAWPTVTATTTYACANPTLADSITGPFSVFLEHGVGNGERTPLLWSIQRSLNSTGFEVFADDSHVLNTFALGINIGISNTFTLGSGALGVSSENFIHRSGISVDGAYYRGYRHGELVAETAGTLLPTVNANRRIGLNYDAGGRKGSAPLSLALVFNRVLSAAEFKSLSDNPWQIFKPREVKIPSLEVKPKSPFIITSRSATSKPKVPLLDKRYQVSEAYFPENGTKCLATGKDLIKNDSYFKVTTGNLGLKYQHKGTEFNVALSVFGNNWTYSSILMVVDGPMYEFIGGAGTFRLMYTGGNLVLFASSAQQVSIPVEIKNGCSVYARWKSDDYVLAIKNPGEEILIGTGNLAYGSGRPHAFCTTSATYGTYGVAYWYDRRHSEDEIKSLVDNPWQIFKSPPQYIRRK